MSNIDEQTLANMLNAPATRQKAFRILVDQYGEKLYWHIRHIVLVHDDANDVLQNVFLKTWNALDNFRHDCKLSTWLYRIAINESLDFMRKKQHANSTFCSESDTPGVANMLMADEYFDGDDAQALLQETIATLPEVQRKVFCMKYYDNMKYSEMSQVLGTSEGALKASYHLAVKKITEFFKSRD